mgnify:CR=1 FL=1
MTMVLDHVGYYFFPEQMEWRVVGRLSMPVWMFLIGYAYARDLLHIFIGAVVLLVENMLIGLSVLPLDILFTILIARVLIDGFGWAIQKHLIMLPLILCALAASIYPSFHYFDYGTAALMYAVLGYITRNGYGKLTLFISAAFIVAVNITLQKIMKPLTMVEFYTMAAGMVTVSFGLLYFTPKTYAGLTKYLCVFTPVIKLMGRHTLILYIIQMLFFKVGRMVWRGIP